MTGGAPAPNPVVQAGWKMSIAILLLLGSLLAVGWILPGAWSAEATRVVGASPDSVFALLEAPRRWDEWTPWPEIPFSYEGPESGAGARRSWDAPGVGAGAFTITETQRPTSVRYRVELGGEDHPTEGIFLLEDAEGGTRILWQEQGDFGSNPVLGWVALSMKRKHPAELERRLEALARTAEGMEPR